jgi:hypothetical protein
MNQSAQMKDLLVLVADNAMEHALQGLDSLA